MDGSANERDFLILRFRVEALTVLSLGSVQPSHKIIKNSIFKNINNKDEKEIMKSRFNYCIDFDIIISG